MKAATNGAGIAGTALAYWLSKLGHEVLLVERASGLRTGGFVLNLWGIGYDALERMGLLPRLLELQHHSDELRMVDRSGRTRGGYPSSVLLKLANGRMATLARSDIAAAIYGSLDGRVETLFGDSVTSIDATPRPAPPSSREKVRGSRWRRPTYLQANCIGMVATPKRQSPSTKRA